MKAQALATSNPSWPAGVLFAPAPEPQADNTVRFPRQASIGPIELRIDGHDGPSAIAILE